MKRLLSPALGGCRRLLRRDPDGFRRLHGVGDKSQDKEQGDDALGERHVRSRRAMLVLGFVDLLGVRF
jgi:hypothetical protein